MEGELLVSIDKSQAYRDGQLHCFSFANGLGAFIPQALKTALMNRQEEAKQKAAKALKIDWDLGENKNISYRKLSFDKNLSKISIIGVGMITTPGITYRMFKALASKKINIMVISTSEIKISVLISSKLVKKAVAVLHKEFKLD